MANISVRHSVQIRREGVIYRRDFSTLEAARRWRDEILAEHPPGRRGRPPGRGKRWTHGRGRYHVLRENLLCVKCKAPVADGLVCCTGCRRPLNPPPPAAA